MSKTKLTAAEWELVKDAPYWVGQALAAAEKKATPAVAKKEEQAVADVRRSYKTTNALVRDIMNEQSEPAATIAKASKADADIALGRIAAIVESKLGGDDLDALNDFLLEIGERVAGAAKENVLGLGEEVSKKEAATLKELAVVLRATDAQKRARKEQAQAAQAAAASQTAREQAQAKARQEAQAKHAAEARAEQEAEARARQKADAKAKAEAEARLEKAREEAEERREKKEAEERLEKAREDAQERRDKLEAERRLEKAREDAEARQKEAQAKREAARAEEERAEAAAREAAAKEAAAKEAAAAPRFTEFIAEHTVVAGENLSFISQKYYGHQGNFRLIYEANKDVIGDNMNLIRPGQKLRIPKL